MSSAGGACLPVKAGCPKGGGGKSYVSYKLTFQASSIQSRMSGEAYSRHWSDQFYKVGDQHKSLGGESG